MQHAIVFLYRLVTAESSKRFLKNSPMVIVALYNCALVIIREKLEDDAEFEVIGDISKLQEDAEKATQEHEKAEAAGSENGAEKEGNITQNY